MAGKRLVVVGASLAGLRAVEAARRAGFDGAITLIGAEEHLPYDRPPLSKAFLDIEEEPALPLYRDRVALDELGVKLLLGAPATGLDPASRTVAVNGTEMPYDSLVIATGATARSLPCAGELAGVHTLRTVDDARAVRKALDAGARTLVIGAGFIGSEVASGARKRGLPVTVVEALPTPLVRAVGEAMGEVCASLHAANGTDLRCGVGVEYLLGESAVSGVRLTDGTVLDAELVVIGTGAAPATDWLSGSGLTLDNGILCDQKLNAGAWGVYAAGDVARWHNGLFDRAMRLEHWTSAAEQGALAARNALFPANAHPYETVPYFWSDWYDTRIQFVGIPDHDEIALFGDTSAHRFVALYRRGDRVTGALAMNRPSEIMKYRGLIQKRTTWSDVVSFATARTAVKER